MATKKIKTPKLKKYSKKPKASASETVWKNWFEKQKQLEKENAQKEAEYHKKVRENESAKKSKESIMKKSRGLSGIAGKKH